MRVIAGSAKGMKLADPPKGVRPVSDMAREGIFSSLGTQVVGARVLDLYAGTGAMGIEALSRGAASADFVDRSKGSISTIQKNLEKTGFSSLAKLTSCEVKVLLKGPPQLEADRYQVVFMDPPYAMENHDIEVQLEALRDGWLATEGWTVVLTRPKKGSDVEVPLHWVPSRLLKYGDSLVTLFREDTWA